MHLPVCTRLYALDLPLSYPPSPRCRVFIQENSCNSRVLINCLLTLLGWIPGKYSEVSATVAGLLNACISCPPHPAAAMRRVWMGSGHAGGAVTPASPSPLLLCLPASGIIHAVYILIRH